jgi:hypothetical protein
MSSVADYAEERAARGSGEPVVLDDDLAAGVGDEMAAALSRAAPLPEPPPSTASPLELQWLRFRDQFAEAMDGGPHSIDALEARIAKGEAYFWPGRNAAIVAQLYAYENGEWDLQTLWAVGDLEEVLSMEPVLTSTARLLGCSGVLIEGRAGWQRMLKSLGYEPWSVTVRKPL